MKRNLLWCLLVIVAAFGVSCTRAPEGMPKMYSCTITVTKDSAPVEGAMVLLSPESPGADLISSGVTDASGNAKIVSLYKNHQAKGAPEGSYKVTITKLPQVDVKETPDEIAEMSRAEQIALTNRIREQQASLPKIVPDALTQVDTTPLHVEVTPDGGRLEVDLSKYF